MEHLSLGRDPYLVAANTSGLKGFSGELLILVRHKMDTQREFVNSGLLATQIVDPDLGVGDTTAEPRLGVRLVLTIAITSCRTSTHLERSTANRQVW